MENVEGIGNRAHKSEQPREGGDIWKKEATEVEIMGSPTGENYSLTLTVKKAKKRKWNDKGLFKSRPGNKECGN